MAVNIEVPELSESVVEATVAEWLKSVGDAVEAGEVVVVLETDKVSLEVTADVDGVIASIAHDVGADVGAHEVLGTIDPSGEAPSNGDTPAEKAPAQEAPAQQAPAQQALNPAPAAAPSAAQPAAQETSGQKATPVAQRAAAAHNVDITNVPAADGSKVRKNDVLNAASAPAPAAKPAAPAPAKSAAAPSSTASVNGREEERVRMTRRRQTIANRLIEAQSTAAMLTTFNEIDMSAVMEIRKRRKESFKEKFGIGLGFSSFFVKAVIGALKAFPYLNAEIQEKEIVLKKYYDIGIAIGAEDGLVVPVLRNADRMSFADIEKQIRDYAVEVKENRLSIDALMGGTFTITNGGVFGSLLSTPILNPPQVGILGLHGIKDRPVVVDGEIVIRPMMYTALTYDHRIVDGREAVQFLVKLGELIEDPESMLLEG